MIPSSDGFAKAGVEIAEFRTFGTVPFVTAAMMRTQLHPQRPNLRGLRLISDGAILVGK